MCHDFGIYSNMHCINYPQKSPPKILEINFKRLEKRVVFFLVIRASIYFFHVVVEYCYEKKGTRDSLYIGVIGSFGSVTGMVGFCGGFCSAL